MEFTLRRIVMRHVILRTCYEAERQVTNSFDQQPKMFLQFVLSATECHFSIDESIGESKDEGFIDIEKEPPIRFALHNFTSIDGICFRVSFQRSRSGYEVNISFHHIAVDGRSIGIFLQVCVFSSSVEMTRPILGTEDNL